MPEKLTRAQVLAEPAGPRLDALVAEHVMGWTRLLPQEVWLTPTSQYVCLWEPSTEAKDTWELVGSLWGRRVVLTLSPRGASVGPLGYEPTEAVKSAGPEGALAAACQAAVLAALNL